MNNVRYCISLMCELARALYKHLQWKYHGVPWPSVLLSPIDLTSHLVKRINEASVSDFKYSDNYSDADYMYV